MIRASSHSALALGLWAAAVAVNPVQAETPAARVEVNTAAREIAKQVGFGPEDVAKVESGEVLTRQLRDEAKKELSVVLFALVPITAAEAQERFKTDAMLEADTTILDWGTIGDNVSGATFAKLRLPADELAKLAGKDVDDDFNLSGDELALLEKRKSAAKSDADRKNAAMETYREILAGRVNAYRSKGLAGVMPYKHGSDESSPRKDLESALPVKGGVVQREAPGFYDYLHGYPNGGSAANAKLVWLLQVLNGRPAVILAHRAESPGDNATVFAQRDFFVGHTFDALQVLGGLVPVGEHESALFYTNSTFTEQVAGFGSGAAHGIGRKIMTKEILGLFEAVKKGL